MKWPFRKDNGRPEWNHVLAEELNGATVLVGITFNEPTGDRLEQFYGTVMSADPEQGITLRLEGSRQGETYALPPDLRAFSPQAAGLIDCGRLARLSKTPTSQPLGASLRRSTNVGNGWKADVD